MAAGRHNLTRRAVLGAAFAAPAVLGDCVAPARAGGADGARWERALAAMRRAEARLAAFREGEMAAADRAYEAVCERWPRDHAPAEGAGARSGGARDEDRAGGRLRGLGGGRRRAMPSGAEGRWPEAGGPLRQLGHIRYGVRGTAADGDKRAVAVLDSVWQIVDGETRIMQLSLQQTTVQPTYKRV